MRVSETGWLACPYCGNHHLKQIYPDESCIRLRLYCRKCRRHVYVTIHDGQCFESQGL